MTITAASLDALLASLPPRLSHIVRPWAERSPESVALVDGERRWTYGTLAQVVRETAERLRALGVRPGDRVMTVGENGFVVVALILAAAELDAWAVIVNARLSAREIDEIITHARPRRIFFAVSSAEARAHGERLGAVALDLSEVGPVAAPALDEASQPEPVLADGARQCAVLLYTSGTTGQPKAVMLGHRSLLYIAAVSGGLRRLSPEDRCYGVLPVSHVFGLASVFLGSLYHGAALHLVPRFEPAAIVKALAGDRLTVIQGVPAMYARFLAYLKQQGMSEVPHPALRFLSSGGAALDLALKDGVERLFGMPLYNGYGLTECAPTISQTLLDAPRRDNSVGVLLPGVEAKLAGDGGPDGVGELCVKGPGVMLGYYRAPEATAATFDAEGSTAITCLSSGAARSSLSGPALTSIPPRSKRS
jgi:long-chain acyl-CoA synthetase